MSAGMTWLLIGALLVVFATVLILLMIEEGHDASDQFFEAEDRDWLNED